MIQAGTSSQRKDPTLWWMGQHLRRPRPQSHSTPTSLMKWCYLSYGVRKQLDYPFRSSSAMMTWR